MKKSIKSLLVATSAMICLSGCGSIDEGSILPVVEAEEVTTTATEVEMEVEEPTVKVETETTVKTVEAEATTKATTGTTKKVTTGEKVTRVTEKATTAKANSKTVNRVTTQPTTSRVTTAVTQPTTAKRVTEKATTARKVTQTVTKSTQKATQKATEKATKKPVQQTTKKPTEKSTTQSKKGYSYKAYVLNEECLTNSVIAIYIKTDNPNGMYGKKGSVIVQDEYTVNGQEGHSIYNAMDYKDVKGISVNSSYAKVDGGYLYSISFDNPGVHTLYIKETVGDEYYCYNNPTKVTLNINVKDYYAEEAKWVKNTVKELSSKLKNLSAKGKIDYLNNWINANFKYELNDGNDYLVYTLNDLTKPYWKSKRGTCITFSQLLCKMAKELGYNAKGEAAGYLQHEYAIVYIDGEWVEYPEQPGSEENVFNPKTVKYWDFSQYK